MKDKKFEIFIIISIIVFSVILLGVFLIARIYNKKNSYTLFTKPFNIMQCVRYKCKSVDNVILYNNKNYEVYLNGKYIGNNKLFYNENNDKYYVFDSQYKNIYNNDNDSPESKQLLMGSTGNVNVVGKSVNAMPMTKEDFDTLSDLVNITIEYVEDLPINKYVADYDADGLDETLYVYNFVDDNKSYSLLAYENDGKARKIEFNKYESLDDFTGIELSNVIDVYDDGKLELLVTKMNKKDYCIEMFRLKGSKFVSGGKCSKYEE